MAKVIIESAVTGSRLPTESPYLPIAPDEIAEHIVASWQAGAAIAHYHVRDPKTGQPAVSVPLFREVATKVKERCDVVLCFAIEGSANHTIEERLGVVRDCQVEMAAISMGPKLSPAFQLLKEYEEFENPWEREYLERSYKGYDHFTYEIMETYGRTMAKYGTKPAIEIFDTLDIDSVVWMLNEGIVNRPLYLQFVLGIGVRLTMDYVVNLYNTAREKFGDFHFAVAGTGEEQMSIVGVSLALGGHARVGMEDAVKNARGEYVKSSAEQVAAAVKIIEGMGLEVATPDDAREILGLKGLDKVNF